MLKLQDLSGGSGGACVVQQCPCVTSLLSTKLVGVRCPELVEQTSTGCELFMRRERRRLQARHIWAAIQPDWPMIKARVWTKHATGLPYTVLHRRLFLHEFTEESRWLENSYKGPDEHRVKWQWKCCRDWFAAQATAQFPSQWVSTLYLQRLDQQDVLSWQ